MEIDDILYRYRISCFLTLGKVHHFCIFTRTQLHCESPGFKACNNQFAGLSEQMFEKLVSANWTKTS